MRLLLAALLVWRTHGLVAQSQPSLASIRRLAPAAFSAMPVAVRRDLERRGCRIPQPFGARTPANVVRGAFTAANVSEWAVLCSIRDSSRILIYGLVAGAGASAHDSLPRSADLSWMQGIGNDRWGFSRAIRRLSRERIRGWRRDADGQPIPQPIDHDAIEERFVGKAAEAFYYAGGRVYRQLTAD